MTEIHPTAIIAPEADIAEGARIGPYCVIQGPVRIGPDTRLIAHVFVGGQVEIAPRVEIFPFAVVGTRTQDLKWRGGQGRVVIGAGTVLREYVTVHAPTQEDGLTAVGERCLLMAGAHVAHDCRVGDGVIMANSSALAGHVTVESQAILGGLCGVHQYARLGRLCIVGACSKVTKDVPPFMMADGHPLRIIGLNRVGLQRHGISEEARRVLRQAHRVLYRQGLARSEALERIARDLPPIAEIKELLAFCSASRRGVT